MKWSGAKDIYVPKIGLSDGIIKSMYYETVSSVEYKLAINKPFDRFFYNKPINYP